MPNTTEQVATQDAEPVVAPADCTCPAGVQQDGPAGIAFCQQHTCEKTPHWRKLCRESADFRRLWEENKGPGQEYGLRCMHRSAPEDCAFCAASRAVTPNALRGTTEINIGGRAIKITETETVCIYPASIMAATRVLVGRPTGTLVDVGCGAGLIGLAGLAVGYKVTFVDRDPDVCKLVAENAIANGYAAEQFEVIQGDWKTLEHAPFDNVYSSETLWDEPAELLAWIDKHWTGAGTCCLSHSGKGVDSKTFAAAGFDLAQTRADIRYLGQACAAAVYLLTRSKIGPAPVAAVAPGEAANVPPPQMPSLAQRGWNLATSLAAFVADGLQTVSTEQYEARLEICTGCDKRVDTTCSMCGCNLSLKAQGRAFECPLKKWPA